MKQAKLTAEQMNQQKVNPLIFGHFIEFMRDCIDEGMWAQLLKNRGFDGRKIIPEGVVDGNPNVADGWYRTGYKNSFEISLDRAASLAKEGYSQKICCYNDYDGYVGIAQGRIYLEKGKYKGYIWAKAEDTADLSISLYEEEGKVYKEQRFTVQSDWKQLEFEAEVTETTQTGIMEIRLSGEGCIWIDGASLMPDNTVKGIWPKVYEYIKELAPSVIRFPGGCFADCYHWEDGIGKRDTRPYRMNRHWGGFEDNSFGTDEYVEMCKNLGCEPMLCVNFGSGTPEEAAAWVEYCNGGAETYYGQLRVQNGHPEPYHIQYWDIGNETFGNWEIGHCSAEEYAQKYLKFYRAMKEKDDSLIFMICGGDGDDRSQEWNRQIAEIIRERMDVLCLHMYTLKLVETKRVDNRDVFCAVAGSVKKYEEILLESCRTVQKSNPNAKIAVTEYNLGSMIDSYREQTLEGAVFVAGMLNMFIRNSEKLFMCNISDLVNGWPGGCIVSKNGFAYGTGSYYVMKLYAESGVQKVFHIELSCDLYDTEEQIGNIEPMAGIPYVDAVLCEDKKGRKIIFAVNRFMNEKVWRRSLQEWMQRLRKYIQTRLPI